MNIDNDPISFYIPIYNDKNELSGKNYLEINTLIDSPNRIKERNMAAKPKLLEQVKQKIRLKHYSIRTEHAYVSWIRRFILFHGKRHLEQLGKPEVEAFLSDLAIRGKVAASTQNQAFCAILFLYRNVLEMNILEDLDAVRTKKPVRLPTVLTFQEVMAIIDTMTGVYQLTVKLLCGYGLRGIECVRRRVNDIDFGLNQIMVGNGKAQKDRVTMLPDDPKPGIQAHLEHVKHLHAKDLREGYGSVFLPDALNRKYKNATEQWDWQG